MTNSKRLLAAMTLAAALAAAARGEEGDAESRFHAAYEAEVVDGKLAESAKVYLSLLGDEKAPARIRAEAKYRFAVTTVLLGRSDEARAHLDDLVRDAATPEPVRARAKASLEAVSGVGLGTELDRKLQSLVFDLGRAGGDPDPPPVYRDFEILGKQAVPMLRQLLAHQDAALRIHAFRLLMRLDEPGMMKLWVYDFAHSGAQNPRWRDLRAYLARRPDERAVLEEAILALDADKFGVVLGNGSWTPSASFLRTAKARGAAMESLSQLASRAWEDPEVEKLRWEWVCDPDPAVARAAAPLVLASSALKVKSGDPEAPKYLAGVVNAYMTSHGSWPEITHTGHARSSETAGLLALTKVCPASAVLEQLERIVAAAPGGSVPASTASPSDGPWPALQYGLAYVLASGVEAGAPTGDVLTRYAAFVLAWADVASARSWLEGHDGRLQRHLAFVLRTLPRAEAEAAARRLFGGGNARLLRDWTGCLPSQTADHFAVVLAAFRAASPEVRDSMWAHVGLAQSSNVPWSDDPGHARAVIEALPENARIHLAAKPDASPWPYAFLRRATQVPPEVARTALLELVRIAVQHPNASSRGNAYSQLFVGDANRDSTGLAWERVVLPAAEELLRILDADGRNQLLDRCLWLLVTPGAAPDREKLADFVAAHVEHLKNGQNLGKAVAILPPERWIARVSGDVVGSAFVKTTPEQTAASDALLARLAPTPADATGGVRAFVRLRCSDELQRTFFDRLFREAPISVVASVAHDPFRLDATPCDPAAFEAAALRLAAATEPLPSRALAAFVAAAVAKQPSDRLFPAVRRLLASQEKADVISGINAAASLGRAELLDGLADKLDSMDAGVREAARKAIDAIVELRGLRDEARKRAAETKSK